MERRSKLKAREVVVKDFYGPDEHLYSDMLGWRTEDKKEARSFVSKDIFKYMIVDVGWNLAFYYVDGDTFYGIHTEWLPIEVKILPRDRAEPYIGLQCEGDTHDDGEVVASFRRREDIWDGLLIDGKSLEEILERSYIMSLN